MPPHLHNDQPIEDGYHFIGIGGIGMSALARILLQRGVRVTGSDIAASYTTEELIKEGAEIFIGHSQDHVTNNPTVVCSTDIHMNNPEVMFAQAKGLSILHRSDLLSHMMKGYSPLLVTGTHGKTTTASLLAHVLISMRLNPAYAIGGVVRSLKSNGAHGTGSYFVAEADESDGSFLKYHPFGAIITNIDNDHLNYWQSGVRLMLGFKQFTDQVISPDHLVWCGDDEKLASLHLNGISYGFEKHNALQVNNFRQVGWKNIFDFTLYGEHYGEVEVPLIGGHNVLNTAAVFGLCLTLNLSEKKIRKALSSFGGVSRRLEKKGEKRSIAIYDDYAHHPTEVFATLRAVKQAVGLHRLVVIFQPHRYTRTKDCMVEFASAFDSADVLMITDIYSAGEAPIAGVSAQLLVMKIQDKYLGEIHYVPRTQCCDFLSALLRPGDTLVTMGAGDITKLGPEILSRL